MTESGTVWFCGECARAYAEYCEEEGMRMDLAAASNEDPDGLEASDLDDEGERAGRSGPARSAGRSAGCPTPGCSGEGSRNGKRSRHTSLASCPLAPPAKRRRTGRGDTENS